MTRDLSQLGSNQVGVQMPQQPPRKRRCVVLSDDDEAPKIAPLVRTPLAPLNAK